MDQWLVDIIEKIKTSNDLSGIRCILVKIREHLNFRNIIYVVKCPETFTRSSTVFVGDYPSEWVERYSERGYVNIDPVALHCFNSQSPYHWKHYNEHTEGVVRKFFGEAEEFKLCDGISIGTSHFDGKTGLISLAVDRSMAKDSAQQRHAIIYMNALQPFIHERISQLFQQSQKSTLSIHLTEREKTCLVWVAEGKTAHDIAAILSISEATVVFHLKNSIQKLNVTNRSQAIAKSVLLGLISPQFPHNSVPNYHF
ncbi:MAG: LuxR family transcriptional regulator [Gammaproteobacteria bacterium]|nr:LuxR family transcriptional regulator [Gammaproteobacteria bacterium]